MREPLSLEIARQAAEAALAAARAEGARVCAVVVGSGGTAKVLLADDGVRPIHVETARRKAYTSAVTGLPSRVLAMLTENPHMNHTSPLLIDGQLISAPGGRPILVDDGEVIGGLGVGGARSDTDERIAEEALKAVAELLA